METYSFLREFADSWFLIAMFVFFLGACIRAFWPSANADRAEASMIPFRNETPEAASPCKNCDGLGCKKFSAAFEMEDANG